MTHTVDSIYQDGNMHRANITLENGDSVSFPFASYPSKEDIAKSVSDFIYTQELLSPNGEDRVYNNGELVRVDTHLSGQSSVGRATGVRAPYNEHHDSEYHAEINNPTLFDEYGVFDRNDLAHWYGIKTTDSGSRFLKVVRYKANWANEPSLPGNVWVYASVFSEDGAESSIKDLYVTAESEEMRQWCVDNDLPYPLPPEETKKPWCYGVYWDSNTGAIEGVKGYVRYT